MSDTTEGATTPNLIAANALDKSVNEAFGAYSKDVISPIKSAAEVCGWLEEIFSTIKKESEFSGNATRIKRLADAGLYLAADMGNYFDCQPEDMFSRLKAVGIVSAEVPR